MLRKMLMRRILTMGFFVTAAIFAAKTATPIDAKELPPAVRKAADRQNAPSGANRSYEKIVIDGSTFYELKIKSANGHDQEILFRPDGSIAETEEEIDIARIPAAARSAIEKAARNGKLVKVDLIRRDGKELYEGEIRENGKKISPIFNAAGERID